MTTTTPKTRTRPSVRATVKKTTEEPQATQPVAKKATPAKRRPAKPKVVETPTIDATNVVEPDVETVIQAAEKPFESVSEADALAAELGQNEEALKHVGGSSDYTIGKESYSIKAINGNADGKYALGIWTRDPNTLAGLNTMAMNRIVNDEATSNDYITVDFAEQNSVSMDLNMAAFFARPGARWNNYLTVGERRLRNSLVNYKPTTIEGNTDRVVAALMRKMEIGNPMLVRLWHSGLVFSFNPPDKAERIAMVDRLNAAHLDTLRRTNGLIHGTSAYYANRIIINDFMKHVTASNVDKSLWPEIYELLDHRDIQFMAWAIMAASHPRGYKLVETCGGLKTEKNADGTPVLKEDGTPKKTICGAVHSEIIDFKLIVIVDDAMFTDWQRNFIALPLDENKPVSREDIIKYQSEGQMHVEDSIVIDDELSVTIKAPTAGLHISIGEEWINSVEQAVDDLINIDADEATRNDYINRQLDATASLDVAHWVVGFNYGGEDIRDRDGITRIFRALGNNEELRDDLFDRIRKGMVKRLGAVVAVPTFKCPSCENLSNVIQNNGTAFYTPIDMVSRFFTLTARSR